MMRKSDIVIIGSGLAGLIAAAAASQQGKSVTLLTKGAGTLAFANGVIDVLGYRQGRPVKDCRQELTQLPAGHPYSVVGIDPIEGAIRFFKKISVEENYPFDGDLSANFWLPTIAGTLKPSCLVPKSMNPTDIQEAEAITVISFAGLKDFYPQILLNGLRTIKGYQKQYQTVTVDPAFTGKRDITALDVARWLDTSEGQDSFVQQLRDCMPPGSFALLPPVLGTEPSYSIWQSLEERLQCQLRELAAPPPGITGHRLRMLLLRRLKKRGVVIVEQGHVQRGNCQGNRCLSVTTCNFGQERSYQADAFILATGSFLGGGLIAEPSRIIEPILDLPVHPSGAGASDKAAEQLFHPGGQPYAQYGLKVNAAALPVDGSGRPVWENVYAAGNILSGYDYCLEKSGNGVAVTSGYHAAMSAIRRSQL
jgi:glycerol-3-phosphate dehydrogenase subunit B